jgi:hypothetical protein
MEQFQSLPLNTDAIFSVYVKHSPVWFNQTDSGDYIAIRGTKYRNESNIDFLIDGSPASDADRWRNIWYDIVSDLRESRMETHYAFLYDMVGFFSLMVQDIDSSGMVTAYKTFAESPLSGYGCERTHEPVKMGKFLKKWTILPDLWIEKITSIYRASQNPLEYITNQNLTYRTGKTREDFKAVYSVNLDVKLQGNTGSYNELASSCMQGDSNNPRWSRNSNWWNKIHPSEAYASGDFVIHSLHDSAGNPVARVVGTVDCAAYGPIYCMAAKQGKALEAVIALHTSLPFTRGAFVGKKLLCLEPADGFFALPYLDQFKSNYPKARNNGSFISIVANNGVDSRTSGFVDESDEEEEEYEEEHAPEFRCAHCGDYSRDEDDYTYVNVADDIVCSHCLRHNCFTSDNSGEVYPNSESCEVNTMYNGRPVCQTWTQEEADNDSFYCAEQNEYYTNDRLVTLFNGERVGDDCGNLIQSNETGEYYLEDSDDWQWHNEDCIARGIIASLLFCDQPVTRCPFTPSLFAA